MVMTDKAEKLIVELRRDPARFKKDEKGYQLLLEFFDGFPVRSLVPLLEDDRLVVQLVAVFIASELGNQALEIVGSVLPLLRSADVQIRYHALETVAVCQDSGAEEGALAIGLMNGLADEDEMNRGLVMCLFANLKEVTLRRMLAVARQQEAPGFAEHARGLQAIAFGKGVEIDAIVQLVESDSDILRKYGAIAWEKYRLRKAGRA